MNRGFRSSRRLRVCVIYPIDPLRPTAGGVATLIRGFIKYAPDDFEIEFIGTTSDPAARPLRTWSKQAVEGRIVRFVPVLCQNRQARTPVSMRFTWALRNLRHDYSGRLLFFHSIEPAILFRDRTCPKVLVIHSNIENEIAKGEGSVAWGRFPWLYFRFEKMVMPFMDHVYTESGTTLRMYQSHYAHLGRKFSFLPTWVDDGIFFPGASSKIAIRTMLSAKDAVGPVDATWILFTGRFHKQKNPIGMVHAFFEYQQTDPRAILILIGAGNMQVGIVRRAEQLGIASRVVILPEQPQLDLAQYYRCADVFLLASHYEGMSVSVLEALASGLPVVSTDTGEVRRVVKSGSSGEIADDKSPATIARCLATVLSNPQTYSSRNCLDAVSEYTAPAVLAPLYTAMRQLHKE